MGKTRITCGSVDCAHCGTDYTCQLENVNFVEWYIHTQYEGVKHLWECKQYEENEDDFIKKAKEFIKDAMAEDKYEKWRSTIG